MQSPSKVAVPGTHAPLSGCAQQGTHVLFTCSRTGLPCDAVRPAAQAPVFNFPGEKQRRFCYDHKLPGMVNLRRADKRPRSAPAAAPPPPLQVSCPSERATIVSVCSCN